MAATTPVHTPSYSPLVVFPSSLNASYNNLSLLNAQVPPKTPPVTGGGKSSKSRASLVAIMITAAILSGPYFLTDRIRPVSIVPAFPPQPPRLMYIPAVPEQQIVWESLLRIGAQQEARGAHNTQSLRSPDSVENGVRIMFLGDSITEGGAAGTSHPRKHPNGSCSYRFSFLSHIARPQAGATPTNGKSRAGRLPAPTSLQAADSGVKRFLKPQQVTTVGPFSSNCGDAVVPDKCFKTLRSAWGQSKALALHDSSSKSIRWRRHASVSGVTALGLIRHREAWPKRDMCYRKSGILDQAPAHPPMVSAMEEKYRRTYPHRVNISDVAVWAATYEPHLVMVLIGTNDLRWGRDWTEILYESIPLILHELLRAADPRSSPLLTPTPTNHPGMLPPTASQVDAPLSPGQSAAASALSYRRHHEAAVCPTFAVLSTLYPRTEFASEVESFNMALLAIQRRRKLGTGVMCPPHDAFQNDNALQLMSGETFLICHPCLRVIDGGATTNVATGEKVPRDEFIAEFTFDGLHPNDKGDEHLGRRMAEQLMSL